MHLGHNIPVDGVIPNVSGCLLASSTLNGVDVVNDNIPDGNQRTSIVPDSLETSIDEDKSKIKLKKKREVFIRTRTNSSCTSITQTTPRKDVTEANIP